MEKEKTKELKKNVEIVDASDKKVDKMPILFKFSKEDIQGIIDVIDALETKGVANAQRIVWLVQNLSDQNRVK